MINYSNIRAGLISSVLLLTTALASPAMAETLPEISPRQIASDVEVLQNPQTGAREFIAPGFDPFEKDPDMAGSASLRSVSGAIGIDGQAVHGGALLDMAFYYNSGSDDPYDTRGYTDAVYLSGEYAPVTRRDNRILECNENVQNVVYYHDDYYRPSLYGGLYRPYPFYAGHYGFSRGYGYDYGYGVSSGFGLFGSFFGGSRVRTSQRRRVSVTNRNRNRNVDRRRVRDDDRTSEERREARQTRRTNRNTDRTREDRRTARETRRDNRETRRANRDNGATGQQTRQSTPRNTRNTAAGEDRLARARRNAFRAERASIVMPRVGNSSTPKTSTSRGTPKASARRSAPKAARTSRPSPRRQSVSQPKPKSTSSTPQRRAVSKPASRSSSRSTSRNSSRSSRNVNVNSKRRLISFLPMASAWSRNAARNVDVHCAREELLTVHIPQDRLDAARFDGLTVIVLDRAGHELPVFVPPNYIEGFRQAVGGRAAPNVYYQEPVTPVPTQPAPVYQDPRTYGYEEASCPAGTTKQADGTCLQGGTVTYGGYSTR